MFVRLKKISYYLVAVYTIAGFILLPLILKPQIIKIANSELNATLSIETLYINPFIFKIELNGVSLKDKNAQPLLSFDSLMLNVDPSFLLFGTFEVPKVLLQRPVIGLTYNKNRTFNLLNILKKRNTSREEDKSSNSMPRVKIKSIEIDNGSLHYKDYTRDNLFEFSFDSIGFKLKDIDTKDINTSNANLRFYTTLGDGGFLDLHSKIVKLNPLVLEGNVNFEASKLYSEWKYVQDNLKLEVADGKISFHTDYYLNLNDLNATKFENLFVGIQNLRIKPKDSYKDILNLENFYVMNSYVKPFTKHIDIEKILLNGLKVNAKRYKNGDIDWIKYLEINSKKALTKKRSTKNKDPWKVSIKDINLEKIALIFDDKKIVPNVKSQVDELNIYAQDVTLSGEKPFSYQINMLLNKTTECSMSGEVIHKKLNITSSNSCKNFDIVHYRPYIDTVAKKALQTYDIQLQESLASFSSKVNIQEKNSEVIVDVKDANVSFTKFKLNKRSTRKRLVSFKGLSINGITLNTKRKDLKIQKVTLNNLDVYAKRYKSKKFNFENLLIPKVAKKIKKKSTQKKYSVNLKHFVLKNSKVRFYDNALVKPSKITLDRVKIDAYNINLKKGSWLSYRSSMRVNKRGIVSLRGKLRQNPLRQKGSFNIKKINIKDINPYLKEKMYLSVDDGSISLKGKTSYSPSSKKADLRVESSLQIDSLFVSDSRNNSSLFTLNSLQTDQFTLELFPSRLYMNELNIDLFYVNAVIDENKTMNFAKLSKKIETPVTQDDTNDNNSSKKAPFPVNISKINVANGSARFSDFSIPIKFSTHIHALNGVLYAVSNHKNEISYINISGEVDEYGSTSLKGSIDASNPKKYTSLVFDFKNLDLNSVSGYSASYAGYKIKSGKLYLDLGYEILNSELLGSNNIIIKKIELGDEVDDENVTVLPLGFVIGLLEDSDGIIEIDMPVEGNLDEPDFKYGALVLKTMGSLITRAVTSPFKFLGAAMGFDAEKLEFINFEPGKILIAPTEREKLDMIAKMMRKKPKITLSFHGLYDATVDKRALQTEKLIDIVLQKSGIKNRKDHENAMSTSFLEEIYKESKDDDASSKLYERLEKMYEGDELARMYHQGLVNLCINIQKVTESELIDLGDRRAETIVIYLTQTKSIEPNRLEKLPTQTTEEVTENLIKMKMQIEVK